MLKDGDYCNQASRGLDRDPNLCVCLRVALSREDPVLRRLLEHPGEIGLNSYIYQHINSDTRTLLKTDHARRRLSLITTYNMSSANSSPQTQTPLSYEGSGYSVETLPLANLVLSQSLYGGR
jgi:hypothetical protein